MFLVLIRLADPRSRCPSVRPSAPTFQNLTKQNKNSSENNVHYLRDCVGLAERIIDDTCLVYFILQQNKTSNTMTSVQRPLAASEMPFSLSQIHLSYIFFFLSKTRFLKARTNYELFFILIHTADLSPSQ